MAQWAAGKTIYGPAFPEKKQAPQKPAGDVEDAIVRLTNAPPDEIGAIADELRKLYQWSAQDGKKLKETLERLQPKPEPSAEEGGR
jgi:hypothetical protein